MTDELAQRYDTQVEVLFNGAANATRRQALPPLWEVFAGRDQRRLSFSTLAAGRAAFSISSNRPGLGCPRSASFRFDGAWKALEPHGAVLASYITPKAIAASSHDRREHVLQRCR